MTTSFCRRFISLALTLGALLFAAAPAAAHESAHNTPSWQKATDWPDRIITTFAGDPATTIAVTWRTDASVGRTIAEIAEATSDTRFDLRARTLRAKTEQVDLERMETEAGVRHSLENVGLGPTHYHSVVFEELKPDTLYAWRVQGDRGNWSEWFQTRTAPRDGPVSFVYFGDAQNGIRSHWSRVIRKANEVAPDADFFLHAGDLVQKGDSDYNWAEWFEAGGFIHARTPSIPVPGNHENMAVWPEGPDGPRQRIRTTLWRPQFTLPVEKSLPNRLHESVYDVRYTKDLHIFILDSARDEFSDQARWLDEKLKQSTAKWKVVTMHHPYFAAPEFDRNKKDAARRKAFAPVIRRHRVDLVLTGHIHTYLRASRGLPLNVNAVRTVDGDAGDLDTVFVISSSGAKNTDIHSETGIVEQAGDGEEDFNGIAVDRVAGNTPMFQVIRQDGDTLLYAAHTATGDVYDVFSIKKSADGTKTIINGEAAFGDIRLFSNTGPYREWWDLR